MKPQNISGSISARVNPTNHYKNSDLWLISKTCKEAQSCYLSHLVHFRRLHLSIQCLHNPSNVSVAFSTFNSMLNADWLILTIQSLRYAVTRRAANVTEKCNPSKFEASMKQSTPRITLVTSSCII